MRSRLPLELGSDELLYIVQTYYKTSNFWYGILKSHFLQVGIIRKIIRRESEIRKFQRRWLPIFIEMSHIVKFNVTKFNSVDSVNC